jgi:hypothetical protein
MYGSKPPLERRKKDMGKHAGLIFSVLVSLFFSAAIPVASQAQTKEDKEFMKKHAQEMTLFMEKCSKCHGLERVLGKKRSPEEWSKTLNIMAGKPHADISEADLKKIEKWIDFYRSSITVSP